MSRLESLIYSYLNGEASDEEVRQLFEWVRSKPRNAQTFARLSAMHGHLREQLTGELAATTLLDEAIKSGDCIPIPPELQQQTEELTAEAEGAEDVVVPDADPLADIGGWQKRSGSRQSYRKAIVAAAAVWIIGVAGLAWFLRLDGDQIVRNDQRQDQGREESPIDMPDVDVPKSAQAFATISQISNAEWGGAKVRKEGDRIGAETLQLKSGIVRIQFDNGAQSTLQGPASFELVALGKTRLTAGLLISTVPPGAEGFRVDTPLGEVVDLGTAFGIELTDTEMNVTVFDGEVEVGRPGSNQKQKLSEGDAVQIEADRGISPAEFNITPYEDAMPVAAGIVEPTGNFKFAPQWPARLSEIQSNTDIFVVPEGYATTLSSPVEVDVTSAGTYHRESDLSDASISSGKRVRSYLLQFNPTDDRRLPARTSGDIKFQGPVLGIIVSWDKLVSSDEQFLQREKGPQPARGLELIGGRIGDTLTLSQDRLTVSLNLTASANRVDHVRVLVDDEPSTTNQQ